MLTDIKTNYTSPAGREFTLAAGKFASVHPASKVLDIGAGYGEGVCNITDEFRCKAVAVDINREYIEYAQKLAVKRRVSHLIRFRNEDILKADFTRDPFDLILAEGGVLSLTGRGKLLDLIHSWLVPRGWVEFSDLILLSDDVPAEVLSIFKNDKYKFETEDSYRKLIYDTGFSIELICLVPLSGWHNYYAHIARRLEDVKGYFAEKKIKIAFHREIDLFYMHKGYKYVGYLVAILRRKK